MLLRFFSIGLFFIFQVNCAAPRVRRPLPGPQFPLTVTPDDPTRATMPASAPPVVVPQEQLRRFALSNGIPVLFVYRAHAPLTAVRYINRNAGEDDARVQAGLASLTTGLLADGTVRHPGPSLREALGLLGASLSTETHRDASEVALVVPHEHVAPALTLLAEVVQSPAFAEADFLSARTAQMDLRASQALSGGSLAVLMAEHALFGGTPYGRPTTGLGPEIRERRREAVLAYHAEHFTPANSALVVVSALEERVLLDALERSFGNWNARSSYVANGAVTPPPMPATRVYLVDRGRGRPTELVVAWRLPERAALPYPTMLLLHRIIGGMFSSRLNLALRAEQGYTYGAYAQFRSHRYGGLFVTRTRVTGEETTPALSRLLLELARLRSVPPSEAELSAAHRLLRDEVLSELERTEDACDRYGTFLTYDRPDDYFSRLFTALEQVSPEQLRLAAHRYLDPTNAVFIVVGDREAVEGPLNAMRLGPAEFFQFQ